jgi:hypothetical protein
MSELPSDLNAPTNGLELQDTVGWLARARTDDYPTEVSGATLPMLSFGADVTLDWLLGLQILLDGDALRVTRANQGWKVDVNEVGARVETQTTVVATRGFGGGGSPFVVDRPVYVWVTSPGSRLPQATMFCHPADLWMPTTVN